MALNEGAETMGRNGATPLARRSRASIRREHHSVYYYALFPNALISLHPDYVMLHTLWPRAVDRTDVICEWYFEPRRSRRTGSIPPTRSTSGTRSTVRTGGSASGRRRAFGLAGYTAGRYSADEGDVHAFDAMVAERYMEALPG